MARGGTTALVGPTAFVERLDRGYDAEVGEGGSRLSVGQRQLVSLARAIPADALHHGRGRTSFVIAQRLSAIRRADRIVVIRAGAVAEAGTRPELVRSRGHDDGLYTRQLRAGHGKADGALEILGGEAPC